MTDSETQLEAAPCFQRGDPRPGAAVDRRLCRAGVAYRLLVRDDHGGPRSPSRRS
jgi:hypothetical protein